MKHTALFRILLVVGLMMCGVRQSLASEYPERPIRYVVAFAPGAFNDILARIVAQRMSSSLGMQVIIDNRAGAGGNLGAELVARASPDGYTLLNISSAHTIAQTLHSKLSYSLERDFAPVVLFASSPLLMTVHLGLPAKTLPEFVKWAKGNRMVYASGGVGVISHLSVEMFKQAAGIEATHVPYKGGGPGAIDVVAGHVHMMTNTLPTLLPFVKGGKLRALGIMSDKRHSLLPELPTFVEQGYNEFVMGNWLGIVAPKGTPTAVINKLAAEVTRIVRSPEVRERLEQEGADSMGGVPKEFAAFISSEVQRFGAAVKASGAKTE